MTQSIIAVEELRRIAQRHALAVVEAEANNGTGQVLHGELLREFQRERHPFLSGRQYTALYRTYSDMVMVAIENYYAPGSATEKPPVKVSSIKGGDEVYCQNAVAMSPAQWDAHIREVVAMAEQFAREIANLAAGDGNTQTRMEEQQLEAAKFSLYHSLNEDEMQRESAIYKEAFLTVLEREANKSAG